MQQGILKEKPVPEEDADGIQAKRCPEQYSIGLPVRSEPNFLVY